MLSRYVDMGIAVKRCTIGLFCLVFSLAVLQYDMLQGGNQYLCDYEYFEATGIHAPLESVELLPGFAFVPPVIIDVNRNVYSGGARTIENVDSPVIVNKIFLRTRVLRL